MLSKGQAQEWTKSTQALVKRRELSGAVGVLRAESLNMAKISLNTASVGDPSQVAAGNSEAAASNERRRDRRADLTVRIDYGTVDEMFSEFTRDINAGGLFIETEKPHAPGTEVSMQFHLPGGSDALQTVGRVVRVSSGDVGTPPGMGIEFDELTAEDRGKIDLIVRALRSESS